MSKLKKNASNVEYVEGEICYCCGTCRFFITPDACLVVEGKISYNGCCDRWMKGQQGLSCCPQ